MNHLISIENLIAAEIVKNPKESQFNYFNSNELPLSNPNLINQNYELLNYLISNEDLAVTEIEKNPKESQRISKNPSLFSSIN